MKALWNLPSPTGDIGSLRSFYGAVENNTLCLTALGKDKDSYRELQVPIIDKFPQTTRTQITRDHGRTEWILKDLRRNHSN